MAPGSANPETDPDFSKGNGLVPVVVQDAHSKTVLMVAYMNREAYDQTLRTGQGVYYSRSRKALWRKGEQSGNTQRVRRLLVDCDRDTLLLEVDQDGAACHEGYHSCFFREVTQEGLQIVAERMFDPKDVYEAPESDSQ